MGNRVSFEGFAGFGLLSEEQVGDLIDMFYRRNDARFVISSEHAGKLYGKHSFDPLGNVHRIKLFGRNIEEGVKKQTRMGGNSRPPDPTTGAARVLVHEIQHANQSVVHSGNEKFYKTRRYNRRPCEREARAFVDDNTDTIDAFLGHQVTPKHSAGRDGVDHGLELQAVADRLGKRTDVPVADILQELKKDGLGNSRNVERVTAILRAGSRRARAA